jgi:peptidoglycan hydrolase-like protein with peptidoglycan-binding domain
MGDYLQLEPGPFQKTSIQGGLSKLVRIWEYLRELNFAGYGAGRLVGMKHGPDATPNGKTSCSPFTATCLYMALDPREVDTSKAYDLKGPYDPLFDGGKVLTRYFYYLHNSFKWSEFKTKGKWNPDFKKDYIDKFPNVDFSKVADWNGFSDSAPSIVLHNLGVPIDDRKMRRGDLVGINWMSGGGHATFCWNVHLDKNGDVDCFQYVSANGHGSTGIGVSVEHFGRDKRYLEESNGKLSKTSGTEMFAKSIDDAKAYPEYSAYPYHWYALRHVEKKDIDPSSFGVSKEQVSVVDWKFTWQGLKLGVDTVCVARLNGVTPPEPWLRSDSKAAPPPPPKPPPLAKVKSKPAPPKPVGAQQQQQQQPQQKPPDKVEVKQQQNNGLDVEADLQTLWATRWITKGPGKSTDVNDAESQAAIGEFQDRYMNGEKIPGRGHADPATRKRLAKYAAWAKATPVVNLALGALHEHGKIEHAPGDDLFVLDERSIAALKDFQTKHKLDVDGVPGAQTQHALFDAMKTLGQASPPAGGGKGPAPAPAKPADKGKKKDPAIWTMYFAKNYGKPGDKVAVVVIAANCEKATFDIALYRDGNAVVPGAGSVTIKNEKGRVDVEIPAGLPPGAQVEARLSGNGLSSNTPVPFEIESAASDANWRPYIGKDSVPDAVLEAVRKNRAKYPAKDLPPAGPPYEGRYHYDYKPGDDHYQWALGYFRNKRDSAPSEVVWKAFLEMLDAEGRPASLQTYDGQIVTWGVGFGGKGNGVEIFKNLDKDPAMKKLLDGLGINYDDWNYHVVDLEQKKVVSSAKGERGNDERHKDPLESWRQQPDLLNAIIGISEDAATRDAVADAQWAVYLKTSARWPGQDKIATPALFFMVAHLHAWLPAVANGVDVDGEFAAIRVAAPSVDTDKQLAPRIAHAFLRSWKAYFDLAQRKDPNKWTQKVYDDIHTRTKTHVWARLRNDAKPEKWDPGEFAYEPGF